MSDTEGALLRWIFLPGFHFDIEYTLASQLQVSDWQGKLLY